MYLEIKECFLFSGGEVVRCEEADAQNYGCAEKMAGLCKEENVWQLEEVVAQLEAKTREPLRIMRESRWSSTAPPTTSWEPPLETRTSSSTGALHMPDLQLLDHHVPALVTGSVA